MQRAPCPELHPTTQTKTPTTATGQHALAKRGKKRARTNESDTEMNERSQNDQRGSRKRLKKFQAAIISDDESAEHSSNDSTYVSQDTADDPDSMEVQTNDVQIKQEVVEITLPSNSGLFDTIQIDEEDKPKMAMHLSYRGHHLPGIYLCVIVEPYPPLPPELLRGPTVEPPDVLFRAPSVPAPVVPQLQMRNSSRAPSLRADSSRFRSETPLFLPDEDATTIAPEGQGRTLPSVPLFHDEGEHGEEKERGDLLTFSQALAGVVHEVGGEESDEDLLRGDADEGSRVLE